MILKLTFIMGFITGWIFSPAIKDMINIILN